MVAALVLAVFACTHIVTAQVQWSPPCPSIGIYNNDPTCIANVNLVTIPAGAIPPVTIPPLGWVSVPTPPNLQITGIISNGGIFYPFNNPPTPPGWNCLPSDWWIANVTLGTGAGACCYDVCICMINCRLYLNPTTQPPPCNP